MSDVFISYSRNDREQVRHIASALEAEGLKVWWDPEIPPGESFANVIDRQLKDSACIVVCWSKSSVNSNWVQEEADDGLMRHTLIPVMLDDVELPRGFKRLQTADLRGWSGDTSDANWQLIIAQVKKLVAAKKAAQAAERQAEARTPPRPAQSKDPVRSVGAARDPRQQKTKSSPLLPIILGLFVIGVAAFGYFFYAKGKEGDAQTAAIPSESAPVTPAPSELRETANIEDDAVEEVSEIVDETTDVADVLPENEAVEIVEVANEEASENETATEESDLAAAPETVDTDETALAYQAGDAFRDCESCPQMVVVDAGAFKMGSPASERSRDDSEGPQVDVSISAAFAIGAYEITHDEWKACVEAGGCDGHQPSAMGWGAGRRPVVNVSFEDARRFADWLSAETGETYRLPTEAEWEYAARAGSAEAFSFGSVISTDRANFNGNYPYGADAGAYRAKTVEVGSFEPNQFGLYDMHGNAWEWVADCWAPNHLNIPADGGARTGACSSRVIKGGAWNSGGWRLRAAHRKAAQGAARDFDTGFRLVREL